MSSRRADFLAGAQATIPLIIGAMPFGVIFGALGVTAGLSPLATQMMSLLVFAGSSQFVAAGLIAQGAGLGIIALTTFVVNLRHALYAMSLAPYMRRLPHRWLVPLGFWLTDESYAVVIRRYKSGAHRDDGQWFYLGSALLMYLNWQLCTLVGILAGSQLSDAANWGLDVAMVVSFIGLVVPLIVDRPMLICALVAGCGAAAMHGMPHKVGLLFAALLGIGAGMLARRLSRSRIAQEALDAG